MSDGDDILIERLQSLVARQHMALMNEGIGPKNPQWYDGIVLKEAAEFAIVAGDISTHDAWDFELIDQEDPRHNQNCNCWHAKQSRGEQ